MNDAIQKLLDDLNQKVEEIRPQLEHIKEVYFLLVGIKRHTGASFEIPDLSFLIGKKEAETAPLEQGKVTIKPDTFYNLELTEAAERYLKMVGHAVSLVEIYEALKKGGAGIESKEKLSLALTRATRRFKKFGTGVDVPFGLLSWYPEKRKKGRLQETPEKIIEEKKEEGKDNGKNTE